MTDDMKVLYDSIVELADVVNDTSSPNIRGHRRGILIQAIIKPNASMAMKWFEDFSDDGFNRIKELAQTIISTSSQTFTTVYSFALFLDCFVELLYQGMMERGAPEMSQYWIPRFNDIKRNAENTP